jgi:glycosyltransferase involved in cell wall biosynthesis
MGARPRASMRVMRILWYRFGDGTTRGRSPVVNRTRILHVIPVLGRGGAPIMLSRLIQAIPADLGYHHEVLVLRELSHFEHDFDNLGIALHTLNLRSPMSLVRALPRLRSLIKVARPDIVQGWMYHGNVAAVLGTPTRTPIVWGVAHSLHSNQGEKLLTRGIIRLGPLMSHRVQQIVFCSEASAQQHFDIGYPSSRSLVIPNGVDTNEFRPAPEGRRNRRIALGLPSEGTLIGHAGRFHPVKNHLGLIRAFSKVEARYEHLYLVLAGRGLDLANKELRQLITEHRLENRVLLLGEVAQIERLLPALDIYVSASHSEAFPVGLLEAMACGVPAVATDVGDSAAIVGEAGIIVPPRDVERLSEGILQMLAITLGERDALAERARDRVSQLYSLSRMADSHQALYASLRDRAAAEGVFITS